MLPQFTCPGHRHHILVTAWSPNNTLFVSADRSGELRVWNPSKGELQCAPLTGHRSWVTSLSFIPCHLDPSSRFIASASKDSTVKIWDLIRGKCEFSLSGHTDSVESVKWGGCGLLYSASRDRTIKVWRIPSVEKMTQGTVWFNYDTRLVVLLLFTRVPVDLLIIVLFWSYILFALFSSV